MPKEKEEAMKYMLLIHQGTTPTPSSPEDWARLSEDERKRIYSDYQALNETPGVSPGVRMQPPETATTVRVEDGSPATGPRSPLYTPSFPASPTRRSSS
jgi:hypothetical protein